MLKQSILLIASLFVTLATPQAQTISRTAGGGGPLPGAALERTFWQPHSVAADASGNFYFSVPSVSRVYKVSPTGILSLLAGTGEEGFSGDGGDATLAKLSSPKGLAVDNSGAIYIADSGNYRIRKVSASGQIATIAGSGATSYCESADGTSPLAACLQGLSSIFVDGNGVLFLALATPSQIYKITPDSKIFRVAGFGTGSSADDAPALPAKLIELGPISGDASGTIYFGAEAKLRSISSNGILGTAAGSGVRGYSGENGPALSAKLDRVIAIATGVGGELYVADNNRVRKIHGGTISLFAGNGDFSYSGDGGSAANASFNNISGLAVSASGNLLLADFANLLIRQIDAMGRVDRVAGNQTGDGGNADNALFDHIGGIAIDADGNIYVSEYYSHVVRKIDTTGTIRTVVGMRDNRALSFADSGNDGPGTSAKTSYPTALAVDASGNLFIAEYGNSVIRKLSPNGIITRFAGTGQRVCRDCGTGNIPADLGDGGPAIDAIVSVGYHLSTDKWGNLYVPEESNGQIRRIRPNGIIDTVAGGGLGSIVEGSPAQTPYLYHVSGVAADDFGRLNFGLSSSNRLARIDRNRLFRFLAGDGTYGYSGNGGPALTGQIDRPGYLATDSAGRVYFTGCCAAYVIRAVLEDGTITTVAGTGSVGYSGDGGPSTLANINVGNKPLAIHPNGDLSFADRGLNGSVIRKVTFPTRIVAAYSRILHSSAGNFDLPILLGQTNTRLMTIEPRQTQMGHKVVLRLNAPVSAVGNVSTQSILGTPPMVRSLSFVGSEIQVDLADISNASCTNLQVNGINGEISILVPLCFLIGDINGSGVVTASDLSAIKANSNVQLSNTNFLADIDVSGQIGIVDLNVAKSRVGIRIMH